MSYILLFSESSGGQILVHKQIGTKRALSGVIPFSSLLTVAGVYIDLNKATIIKIELVESGEDADIHEKYIKLVKEEASP